MTNRPWFKMYVEIVHDPKVRLLAPEDAWSWVLLLALCVPTDGVLPPIKEIAWHFDRRSEIDIRSLIDRLSIAGLIDTQKGGPGGVTYVMHNWQNRQSFQTANAKRQQKHRDKNKALRVTPILDRDVDGEGDSERKIKKEVSEASPPRRSDEPIDVDFAPAEKPTAEPTEPPPLALVPTDEHGPGKVSSEDIATAVKIYNWCAEMGGTGWPKCEKLNDTRRKNLKARLAEAGLDGWRKAMELARHSDFLTGRKSGWVPPGIEWFVKQANFLKIIEGTYVNRSDQSRVSRAAQAADRFNDYFDREGIA